MTYAVIWVVTDDMPFLVDSATQSRPAFWCAQRSGPQMQCSQPCSDLRIDTPLRPLGVQKVQVRGVVLRALRIRRHLSVVLHWWHDLEAEHHQTAPTVRTPLGWTALKDPALPHWGHHLDRHGYRNRGCLVDEPLSSRAKLGNRL
ncbi:hypothetical protein [Streptomyces noursei]|uniref:hypothetical protein n=1 Tax=Streptomyces noursei TaxID=1971 RepID=UPI003B8A83BF